MSETSIRHSYTKNTPRTPEQISRLRAETDRKGAKYWAALGMVVLAGTGVAAYEHFSTPKTKQITEVVKPYDNPTTLVERGERAMKRNLEDPAIASFIAEEAWKIQQEHPVIHPGETITLDVR